MDPFIGEIRVFGGNFAPRNWMLCDGRTLQIAEHDALFNLIGTTYGGDGNRTFNLPDLRGRIPIAMGQGRGLDNYAIGDQGGLDSVPLTGDNLPAHTHALQATTDAAKQSTAQGALLAQSGQVSIYTQRVPNIALGAAAISPSEGGSKAHENRMPSLTLTYIICVEGIFPSRS